MRPAAPDGATVSRLEDNMNLGKENDPYGDLVAAIACYQAKHGGFPPKRIFVSDQFLRDLATACGVRVQTGTTEKVTFYGVPISLYHGDGDKFYMSDEEELL